MGLPRSLAFLRTGTGGQSLEVFIDPLCPPSRNITRSLAANVVPHITKGGKYEGKLQLITRIYPQPFHYLSAYPSEALLVFGQEHPDLFWDYLLATYDIQENFFNRLVLDKTPREVTAAYVDVAVQVIQKAGKLGAESVEVAKEALTSKLAVHEKNNGGSSAFLDFKFLIREGRQNGIHVTPTALLNGLEDPAVSSGWGKAEWEQYLADKLD
ncbi:uncharacterized protein LOC62_01G001440 [Vanrija pseudolonga]|uniref:Thioredoxin-like fold domain-containing protein n=1 Tax=Vanrija pseudolonga TaxID=143232 RepID=A0AAF0Y0Q9_9TREE|nr:hypothetical protein LOC62_01G001440 [Vanrija pseudolonga]